MIESYKTSRLIFIAMVAISLSLNSIVLSVIGDDSSLASDDKRGIFKLGPWSEEDLNGLMQRSSKIQDVGERIDFLSGKFLRTKYEESTLVGDVNQPEELVIDLEGMDCFTYIDYVEAMQLSDNYPMFVKNIQRIRYQSGEVDYSKRNHFFTDWAVYNDDGVVDVTKEVGGQKTRTAKKLLNRKDDGTYYLPGIPVKERMVNYIPSEYIDKTIIGRLKTGDYIGIYSDKDGLDVSHTGILIKKRDGVFLRHASSRKNNRRVVDEELITYINDKPGVVVLRPKDNRLFDE